MQHLLEPRQQTEHDKRLQQSPQFNVVLIDDDTHTFEYVIEMLALLFNHPAKMGLQIAHTVNDQGRAIVFTCHQELAELKRDQILGYGPDVLLKKSRGSMLAVIEAVG